LDIAIGSLILPLLLSGTKLLEPRKKHGWQASLTWVRTRERFFIFFFIGTSCDIHGNKEKER
jgi:hypothetical protein